MFQETREDGKKPFLFGFLGVNVQKEGLKVKIIGIIALK